MTTEDKTRLTIDLDASLCQRIQAVAARLGVSPSEYCRQILEDAVASDEPKALTYEEELAWLENLERLRSEIFGDRVLPDSVPMIRKMRGHED